MQEKMRKGLVVYVVMLLLGKDEIYVADIISWLEEHNFAIAEWTLYPLLNRLKKEWIVIYERKESTQWPPRKYYKLSKEWMKQLQEMTAEWKNLSTSINTLQ